MTFLVPLVLAIAAWFYIAALYQNHGYAWIDQTCSALPSFCANPNKVAIGAIAVVVFFLIAQTMRD